MNEVRLDDHVDAGGIWHFGDPMAEQRRLASGAARVDLSHRPVFRVSGPDRLKFLHTLTTNRFDTLHPGSPMSALLLNAQGRIEYFVQGVDDGTSFLAHTEPAAAQSLIARLRSMIFRSQVSVDLVDDLVVVGRGDGSVQFVLKSQAGADAGIWAWEALRIARGEPRIGVDTDDRTIPNELGLYATLLDKGCYPGQETVARVQNLGRPPRRLVRLHLDGSEDRLPGVGSSIMVDDRSVGRVGSSARHFEAGPIALGLITRSVPVNAVLTVEGIAAAQEVLVDPEIGAHFRPDPKLTRRKLMG